MSKSDDAGASRQDDLVRLIQEHTKAMAPLGAAKLERILRRFLRQMAQTGRA